MRNYIDLMSLRLSDKVDLQVSFPTRAEGTLIAPLLFITLVENAFKHGISPTAASHIHIALDVEPAGIVACRIENSNHPNRTTTAADRASGCPTSATPRTALSRSPHLRAGIEGDVYIARLQINTCKP